MQEFVQQLLRDSGVPDDMDIEVRSELVDGLLTRISDLINRRLIDAMSDEQALAFERLVDENPEDMTAMQQFIADAVPNKDQVVATTLLEFRALYLGDKA